MPSVAGLAGGGDYGTPAAKLGNGPLGLVFAKRLAVTAVSILQLGKSLALEGLGDNHRRPVLLLGLGVGLVDGGRIVAINLDGVPAKCADALGVGPGVPAEGSGPALAEPVDVNDAG